MDHWRCGCCCLTSRKNGGDTVHAAYSKKVASDFKLKDPDSHSRTGFCLGLTHQVHTATSLTEFPALPPLSLSSQHCHLSHRVPSTATSLTESPALPPLSLSSQQHNFMSRVHVIAACTSCILLLLCAACLCDMYMLHAHALLLCCSISLLHFSAVCLCCMSLKCKPACHWMSMLHVDVHAICPDLEKYSLKSRANLPNSRQNETVYLF
jgi:hypothetical protein